MRVFDSRKYAAFAMVLLAFTFVVQAAAPQAGTEDSVEVKTVKDVAITPKGDATEARITTSGPAKFTYFELTGPRRLVVDFQDLQNGVAFKEKQISSGGVERVRAGVLQEKDRTITRIVFDLTIDAQYQI